MGGHAALFEQQLCNQESRHPQVGNGWHAPKNLDAWHIAQNGKRMPPVWKGGSRIPLVDLLVCASVCVVCAILHRSLAADEEAVLVFVLLVLLLFLLLLFVLIVRRHGSQ